MDRLLPYKTEYAKSGRSTCRSCRCLIEKNFLRISKRKRSFYHDGMDDHWYHPDCIFSMREKPLSIELIANFDNIKWEDQEFLKQRIVIKMLSVIDTNIEMFNAGMGCSNSKKSSRYGRRHSEPWKPTPTVFLPSSVSLKRPRLEDFTKFKIEYAQNNSRICFCDDSIEEDDIQVCQKEEDTGLFEDWHHLHCFADLRDDFKFFSSGSCLPGFYDLDKEDQATVLKELPPINDENLPPAAKRANLDSIKTAGMSSLDIIMMTQNEKFTSMRKKLENVKREDMIQLLTHNDQRYAQTLDDLKDALADRLAFGAVSRCTQCSGRRKFTSGFGYACTGNLTEWVKCQDITISPEKSEFRIPPNLKEKYEFLKYYVPNVETRLIRATAPKNLSLNLMQFDDFDYTERTVDRNKLMNSNSIHCKKTILDPKTDFEGIAKVFTCGSTKYAVTLGLADLQTGYNSFYKLQILEYLHADKYSLFRSWGRTGTQVGGSKVDVLPLDVCMEQFKDLFFEKSGNSWMERNAFVKHSHKMYLIDTEDDTDYHKITNLNTELKSKLQPKIQNLMNLIFNLNIMKSVMVDFKIDLDRMPLGKLSRKQIEKAFEVLQELQILISSGVASRAAFLDASNKFYTLIPHSFGVTIPPILDDAKIIKQKCDMLNALMDIEVAYNLINLGGNEHQHPLDAHYEKLNTQINILDNNSEEYKMIEKYAKNTHAHTHSEYTLQIENVFKIERHGEANRYQLFESLHNKKLLWHGSRTTNFAGILSQGLRIAPPEAPASGYMFGKGIYFADMVSKSANYCFADGRNSTGLLLLCEVALGNMYEKRKQCPNLRLPRNKHSTFGKGKTFPHPDELYRFPNGTEVPYGYPVYDVDTTDSQLLYNEYIVYNPAQVRTRYLVQVKFNFRH